MRKKLSEMLIDEAERIAEGEWPYIGINTTSKKTDLPNLLHEIFGDNTESSNSHRIVALCLWAAIAEDMGD